MKHESSLTGLVRMGTALRNARARVDRITNRHILPCRVIRGRTIAQTIAYWAAAKDLVDRLVTKIQG